MHMEKLSGKKMATIYAVEPFERGKWKINRRIKERMEWR